MYAQSTHFDLQIWLKAIQEAGVDSQYKNLLFPVRIKGTYSWEFGILKKKNCLFLDP